MADVVVVVPVLDRPHRVAPLVESLFSSIFEHDLDLLFVASPGDAAEIAALEEHEVPYLVAGWPPGHGDWARKINLAYRSTTAAWVFTGADDLCFCPEWADAALECAAATGAGVIGTNDLGNGRVRQGLHATHNLVARWYADERGTLDGPGAVVTEVYSHNYVDDELVRTAQSRGLWTFCRASEVPHLHPNWRRDVPRDATYDLGQRDFDRDRVLFMRRHRGSRPL